MMILNNHRVVILLYFDFINFLFYYIYNYLKEEFVSREDVSIISNVEAFKPAEGGIANFLTYL